MSNQQDHEILRELAAKVADIAELPVQQEKIKMWKALNRLEPARPLVMVHHIPWHEMQVKDELTPRCTEPLLRRLETDLRRTLYSWRHLPTDRVVEPFVRIPKAISGTAENLGIVPVEDIVKSDPDSNISSHCYTDQFEGEDDLEKIKTPEVFLDEDKTMRMEDIARDALDGILDVRMEGHCPRFTPWDRIAEWRGAEKALMDLAVRPEFMHHLMRRVTDAFLDRLDSLEAKGLLGCDQAIVKNSGAFTDELPAEGFTPDRPRAQDIWSSGMAQLLGSVSPEMHNEFEIEYAMEWYGRFGLNYYGCCEPLDDRLEYVFRIPNLRKISVSPWAEKVKAAESIVNRFVFSCKPNPVFLAGDSWQPERVRADLLETRRVCERFGCPLEFILQDLSTVSYQPQRLWQWCEIAMDVAR